MFAGEPGEETRDVDFVKIVEESEGRNATKSVASVCFSVLDTGDATFVGLACGDVVGDAVEDERRVGKVEEFCEKDDDVTGTKVKFTKFVHDECAVDGGMTEREEEFGHGRTINESVGFGCGEVEESEHCCVGCGEVWELFGTTAETAGWVLTFFEDLNAGGDCGGFVGDCEGCRGCEGHRVKIPVDEPGLAGVEGCCNVSDIF